MVLVVNIDSPSRLQVKTGNNIKPVDEPTNRADQTDPVVSVTNFQAYQNSIDVGTPKINAETIGLFFHHPERNCAFI